MKTAKLNAAAALLVLAACSDSNTGTMNFSLTSRQAGASGAAVARVATTGDSTVIALGNDSVIVRSAELVLRKIELKRVEVAACDAVMENGDCEEDRKSTRLNSSHVEISYAVFCLKKKKAKTT